MRHTLSASAIVLSVLTVAPLAAQADWRPLLDRLRDAPAGTQASLSPDGASAALLRWDADGSEVVVHEFATGNRRVVLPYENRHLQSCAWKSAAELLCLMNRERGRTVLLRADVNAATIREVGKLQRLTHVLPDHSAHVIGVFADEVGALDLGTGRFRAILNKATLPGVAALRAPVTANRSRARNWQPSRLPYSAKSHSAIDGRGVLRVRPGASAWLVLGTSSESWTVLHPYEHSGKDWFEPLAFDERSDEVLYLDTHDGYTALFASTARERTERLVLAPESAHVIDIDKLGRYPRPSQAVVFDGQIRFEPIDPLVARVHDVVRGLFPDDIVDVLEEDWSQRYYLVRVVDRIGVGHYYRFDSIALSQEALAPTRPGSLTKVSLRRARLDFESRNGKRMAYVTAAKATAPPRPIVVVPGAAGSAVDELVMFLATNGYAVLELPVPALLATDIGVDLRATRDDVGPAIRAMAANHAVDSTRICAVGIEESAYVALLHAAQDPSLLRCVVGIETVVNPDWPEARSLLFEGPAMTASILLVESSVLPIEGVARLRKRLADDGVLVELALFPNWEYETPALQQAFYDKLGGFLRSSLR